MGTRVDIITTHLKTAMFATRTLARLRGLIPQALYDGRAEEKCRTSIEFQAGSTDDTSARKFAH